MISKSRILICASLVSLTIVLVLHAVAMGHGHWKIYDHRTNPRETIYIGLFRRCEYASINISTNLSNYHLICNDNKYCFDDNKACINASPTTVPLNVSSEVPAQRWCNTDDHSRICTYSTHAKGLISCSIIAACAHGLALFLIFSHLLVGDFQDKTHFNIALVTCAFLLLGMIFMLATLITLGATFSYDLYEYRYNLNSRSNKIGDSSAASFRDGITDLAHKNYDRRIDWAGSLEIVALILSSFTFIIQILYLIFVRRNYIG